MQSVIQSGTQSSGTPIAPANGQSIPQPREEEAIEEVFDPIFSDGVIEKETPIPIETQNGTPFPPKDDNHLTEDPGATPDLEMAERPEVFKERAESILEPAPEEVAIGGEDLVELCCPSCGEDLSLKEEHIGVRGACVFCHTPIMAHRFDNGSVGVIRISEKEDTDRDSAAGDSPFQEVETDSHSWEDATTESSPFEPDEDGIERASEAPGEESVAPLTLENETDHGDQEVDPPEEAPSPTPLHSLRRDPAEHSTHDEATAPEKPEAHAEEKRVAEEISPADADSSDFTPMSDEDFVETMLKSAPEHPATGLEDLLGVNSDTAPVPTESEPPTLDAESDPSPFNDPGESAAPSFAPLSQPESEPSHSDTFPTVDPGFGSPASEESSTESSDDATSLFSSTPLFAPPESEGTDSATSLFGSGPSSPGETPGFSSADLSNKPLRNVKPSPLAGDSIGGNREAHPKKKRARLSNTTVILLLIMVGSISGAGLAAFFVPVDYPAGKANVVIENNGNEDLKRLQKNQ